MKKLLFLLFFLFAFAGRSNGQWKKLFDFGSGVRTIYFKEYSSAPLEGFVSVDGGTGKWDKLWRTLDGGQTWKQISFNRDNHGWYPTPGSFTFKNRFEGWFAEFLGHDVYHTVDGGANWVHILGDIPESQIYYVPSTGRLLLSGSPTYYYSTDGITFQPSHISGAEWMLGIAFSDDLHGIMSSVDISPTVNNFLFTSDGGLTWNISDQLGEQYAPVGVRNTKMFYAICENDGYHLGEGGKVIRSDDGGATWSKIYQYHDMRDAVSVTGTMQANASSVFFQTIDDSSEGIMMSQDSGITFRSLCGPPNIRDSRFYCRDSFLYAADKSGGLWLNTTGIGSNSTPQITATNITVKASACAPTDTIITFTFFDSCSGVQAKLVSAALDRVSNFTLKAPFDRPRQIHPGDSIKIHYVPSILQSDDAILHLRFHLGFKDFDTSIILKGRIIATAEPRLSASKLSVESGSCGAKDSLIIFSCFDSCTGTQAVLENVIIQGSSNFLIIAPTAFPRALHFNDSLIIRYAPVSFSRDTSIIHLLFRMGAIDVDTVIYLFGRTNAVAQSSFSRMKMEMNVLKCNSTDSLITFSFFDSCTKTQATLLGAEIQGANTFSLLFPSAFPRLTYPVDTLRISYDPKLPGKETANLVLHFALGFQFFDKVIELSGNGRTPKETARFIPSLPSNTVEAGTIVHILVKPDKMLIGKGLQSISFNMSYYGDLLRKDNAQSTITNTIVTSGTAVRVGKKEVFHVSITGNDITLDPSQAIADLSFMTMVTDTLFTQIAISDLSLNDNDFDYRNCILSADTSSSDLLVTFVCGDSTLYKFIRTADILTIVSIHPNPSQDEILLDLHSSQTQSARMEIVNALGAVILSEDRSLASGANKITINTLTLPQGMYLLRIRTAENETVRSFVKVR